MKSKALLFFIILTLVSCQPQEEEPKLSGLLWGGQGNRLLIELLADSIEVKDTLLINHEGKFFWKPDTFITGIYRIHKNETQKLTMLMRPDKEYYIDGQYFSFPEQAVINEDENISVGYTKIDKFSAEWQKLNLSLSNLVKENRNKWTKKEMDSISVYLDSVDAVYKTILFDKDDHPVENMYALMQKYGDRYLFDIIEDSTKYLYVANRLRPYREIPTVNNFLVKTDSLKQYIYKLNKTALREPFPFHIVSDTSVTNKIKDKIVYIEIIKKGDLNQIRTQKSRELWKYYNSDVHFCFLVINNQQNIENHIINNNFCFYIPDSLELISIQKDIFISNKNVNYIVNHNGKIVARNIEDKERNYILDELLKNKVSLSPIK